MSTPINLYLNYPHHVLPSIARTVRVSNNFKVPKVFEPFKFDCTMCAQRRLRLACASSISDGSLDLRWQIRLGGRPG